VHAGNVNEVVAERPRNWDEKKEFVRNLLDKGFTIRSSVDLQCGFAKRGVRPCLHPGARMLVVFEHQTLVGGEGKRTCIDFDNRQATAARIRKDLRPDIYDYDSWTWEGRWSGLLAK
jgi:hypothetical protein